MTIPLMQMKERFAHQPLIPNELAVQQSTWRQRWGLPPRPVHAAATDWKYHIEPAEITGHRDPRDPSLRLVFALRNDTGEHEKYFLTGSRGAGKSTVAYSLYNDRGITERFHVLVCSISDYLNLAATDAGQVLAVMIAQVIESIKDAGSDASLGVSSAKQVLADLDKQFKKVRAQARLDGATVNIFGLLSAQFSQSESVRKQFSQYVDGHFDALMGLFDELVGILEAYKQKKLLIVIDDLDKVSASEINGNLFHVQLPMLLRPSCAALYTFPLELHWDPRFERLKAQPNRYVLGNVQLFEQPGHYDLLDEGRRILEEFIIRRLQDGDVNHYLETAAMDRVYRYSCGNYRELCRILQHAFQTAAMLDKQRVDRECLQAAVDQLRQDYNPYLQRYRGTLNDVRENLATDQPRNLDSNTLTPLIQALAVVEYPDSPGWLDVHPVLQDLMDGEPSTI